MSREHRNFSQVGRRTQIDRMRAAGTEALLAYGIAGARLRLINHDHNTTFRVDTEDGRFALRISMNSHRSPDEVAAELAWMAALRNDTDLLLPRPIPTSDGAVATTATVAGMEGPVPAALFTWLDGPNLGDRVTRHKARQLGRVTAELHHHAGRWQPPADVRFPAINGVLLDSDDHLANIDRPWLDDDMRAVLGQAAAKMEDALTPVFNGECHVLHADLHPWNTKWNGGRLAVFDFNDCGIGVPVQDLAISAYYLRNRADLEDALLSGYAELRPVPDHTTDQFEALVASRNLLLLNDVAMSITADHDDFIIGYAARTTHRLRHYVETGSFLHQPPDSASSSIEG